MKLRRNDVAQHLLERHMISDLLIRLGFYKITKEELLTNIEELYAKTIEQVLKDVDMPEEITLKSKFEITHFFHCVSIPIFQRLLKEDTWDELRYFIQDDLMVRGIQSPESETIKSIIKERFELHNDGLYQGTGNKSFGENYYKLLFDLFYEHPMEPINEIKRLNKLDLNFHTRSKKQARMTLFVKHLVPAFRKSTERLSRMTRK